MGGIRHAGCGWQLLVAALFAPATLAQNIVQPLHLRSPSGQFELDVDPSRSSGAGPATYRLRRDGKELWTEELPFTLVAACVDDDGTVAGHGTTEGEERGFGELLLAVLAPDGSLRWDERVPRGQARPHGAILPSTSGLSISPRDDLVAWEVSEVDPSTVFRIFRLSTGEELPASKTPPELREPLVAERSTPALSVPPRRELELVPLGRVHFAGFDGSSHDIQPNRRFVDARGRVWISEVKTDVVHAFDPTGQALFKCTPGADDGLRYHPYDWLSVRSDGHLFAGTSKRRIEFDEHGARVDCTPSNRELSTVWLFLPSGGHWEVDQFGVALFDPDGEPRARIERSAQGRWFRSLGSAAVAPDGTLAVLDAPEFSQDGDPTRLVQLLAPGGAPREVIPIPAECSSTALAFDGRHLALLAPRELWALSSSGAFAGRADLPQELLDPREVFFSPDGTELWIFTRPEPMMHRFSLRWR